TKEVRYDSKVLGQLAYAGRNCLKVKSALRQFEQATLEAPDGSGRLTAKIRGTGSVIWLFDPNEGLVMKSDSDSTMSIAIVMEAPSIGEQTLNASATVTAHARMTEYNG
ncbi:MAG: hypothetical protein GTN78_05865, partial [Gemmatimonadales bacterium]|nr:hypothetical protein [Gemmatimonadales bacterium]